MATKVLFLLPYPLHQAPSQRFRVEAFFSLLKVSNIQYQTDEFLNDKAWRILYKNGSALKKGWFVIKSFFRRLFVVLFAAKKYTHIFIHREASPLGPPLFEWWLAKVLKKKIIYDFDDAIWIPNITESNRLARLVKCFWKVKYICKWSYRISVGNDYLATYAKQYNSDVTYNPTCVDTVNRYNIVAEQHCQPVTIGWTGSHSTIQFLAVAVPALKKLEQVQNFRLLVICDQKPEFDIASMEFMPWNKETEIEDLAKINIGIMPLKTDAWSEGKCGFKIIQYMALGIPAVASPVGVNKSIIDDGVNGYICQTDDEWINCLTILLQDEQKRKAFGNAGKRKIEQQYSISSNSENFLSLLSN